jgi:hypothetical protein
MMKKQVQLAVAAIALATGVGAQAQSSVTIEDPSSGVSLTLTAVTSSSSPGTLTFYSPASVGGSAPSLTLSDLSVDLTNNLVYGSLNGGSPIPLWTGSVPAPSGWPGGTSYPIITSEAFQAFQASLGTFQIAGTTPHEITLVPGEVVTLNPADLLALLGAASDVPEPGTWATLGLGLVGISLVRRQRG